MKRTEDTRTLVTRALTNVLTESVGSVSQNAYYAQLAVWGQNGTTFLSKFNPDLQYYCASHPERCFTANTPTLHDVRKVYGSEITESWLDIQLTDLVKFAGVKKENAGVLIRPLAQVLASNYGFLKVSELMLFFQQFKGGMYGRFYGQFDPMVVTEGLHDFLEYRNTRLAAIERRKVSERRKELERKRQRQEAAGELLTAEEWKEIGWLFNMGYEMR